MKSNRLIDRRLVANLQKLKVGVFIVAKSSRKGHEGYYKGKRIDYQKFMYSLSMFVNGQMTLEECAEYCNVSRPTIRKYFNKFLIGEEIPKEVLDGKRNTN